MAVASDAASGRESFKPTTQDADQFSREIAERMKDPNMEHVGDGRSATAHGAAPEDRDDENIRRERHAPGYTEPENGYRSLDAASEE